MLRRAHSEGTAEPGKHGQTVRRVCVIGAGVVGLSTAVRIQEVSKLWSAGPVEVTVIADRFSPHTTGDGSAGLWVPFRFGATSPELVSKWSNATWAHMSDLAMAGDGRAALVGTQFISGYNFFDAPVTEPPPFKDTVLGCREMTPRELGMFPGARSGYFYTTVQMNLQKYLPWLMQRFKDAGGKTEFQTVENLWQVADDYDVVVNCCGVRAGQLVNDPHVIPVRGQLRRVRAPWVKHFYLFESETSGALSYTLPLGEEVVVGGVAQEGNWNEGVDPADSDSIWTKALVMFPFLKNAPMIREWAGLRPGRSSVRLEADRVRCSGGHYVPVIHNYGHGGSGVSLHWGCAADAADLVRSALSHLPPPTHSKL